MRKRGVACLLVTIVLLGVCVWWAGAGKFVEAFKLPNYGVVALALLFTPVLILLKASRWHMLVRSQIADAAFAGSLKSYLTGLMLAAITPLSAGEVARGVYVSATRRVELTGLVLVDKFFDLTAVCLCGCAGIALLGYPWIGAAAAAAIGVAWCIARRVMVWLAASEWAARRHLVSRIAEALGALHGALIAKCLAVALVNFVVYYVQVYVVFRSFGQPLPLAAVSAFPLITLSTVIPFAVGGLGIRELCAQVLLAQFGMDKAVTVSAYLIQHVLVMIVPALVGGLWLGELPVKAGEGDEMGE